MLFWNDVHYYLVFWNYMSAQLIQKKSMGLYACAIPCSLLLRICNIRRRSVSYMTHRIDSVAPCFFHTPLIIVRRHMMWRLDEMMRRGWGCFTELYAKILQAMGWCGFSEEKGAGMLWGMSKKRLGINIRRFLNNANLYIVTVTGIMYDSTRW